MYKSTYKVQKYDSASVWVYYNNGAYKVWNVNIFLISTIHALYIAFSDQLQGHSQDY